MPNLNINKIRVPAVARSGRIYTGNLYAKFGGIGVAGGIFYDSGSTHTSQSRYTHRHTFGIGGGRDRGSYSSLLSISAPADNISSGIELIGSNTESGKFSGISLFNKVAGVDYLSGELYMTSLSPNVWHLDLADTNEIMSSSWSASLESQHWSITGSEGMRLTEDGLRVHRLVEYEYDLSSQYTDRTLIDKGWYDSQSGSFTTVTASYALEALTASYALNVEGTLSASYSETSSYALNVPDNIALTDVANTFVGNQVMDALTTNFVTASANMSPTSPIYTFEGDYDSGIGRASASGGEPGVSIISNGREIARFTEAFGQGFINFPEMISPGAPFIRTLIVDAYGYVYAADDEFDYIFASASYELPWPDVYPVTRIIKNLGQSTITITASGSGTIDGLASRDIESFDALHVVYDGSGPAENDWYII